MNETTRKAIQAFVDMGFTVEESTDLAISNLQSMLADMRINRSNAALRRIGIYDMLCKFSRALRAQAVGWTEVGGDWHADIKKSLEKAEEFKEFPLWEYTEPSWRETEWPSHPRKQRNEEFSYFKPENL